jgi:hypothetical protein
MATTEELDRLRSEWLERLSDLVESVQSWAEELGWATRQIEVALNDSQLGKYQAPALLLQEDAIRILLEPIARAAPGAQGVVDLYLMPGYDDVASLYFCDGDWSIHYMFPGSPTVATIRDAESKPLTQDSLCDVLEEMKKHAV